MEKLIQKILEIEKEAQNLVGQGKVEAEKHHVSVLEETEDMNVRISNMAKHKIDQLEKANQIDKDNKISDIQNKTAIKMRILEDAVGKNRDIWENQIYNSIVKKVEVCLKK